MERSNQRSSEGGSEPVPQSALVDRNAVQADAGGLSVDAAGHCTAFRGDFGRQAITEGVEDVTSFSPSLDVEPGNFPPLVSSLDTRGQSGSWQEHKHVSPPVLFRGASSGIPQAFATISALRKGEADLHASSNADVYLEPSASPTIINPERNDHVSQLQLPPPLWFQDQLFGLVHSFTTLKKLWLISSVPDCTGDTYTA